MAIVIGVFSVLLLNGNALVQANVSPVNVLQYSAARDAESGKYDEATNLYTKQLNLLLANGKRSEAGGVYLDLAEVSHLRGAFSLAESSYKRAIDLLRHNSKPNDAGLVHALDGLGWLYVTWGRDLDALRTMDQARELGERLVLSADNLLGHLDTQAAYLSATNRYSEAKREWKQALDVRDANYGPDSATGDVLLLHFGQASAMYRDYANAQQMFLRYMGIEERRSTVPSISRAAAAAELGHLNLALHKTHQAQYWLDQAIGQFNRSPEEAPLVFSIALCYHGDLYMALKNWAAAQGEYRRALVIREKVLGDNHASATCMMSLSGALAKLHRKTEAKALTARANAILAAEKNPLQSQLVDVQTLRGQ